LPFNKNDPLILWLLPREAHLSDDYSQCNPTPLPVIFFP
jgi:hypothetical protein